MDNEVHVSLLELDEAEKQVEEALADDDDFEEVEDLTLPVMSKWDSPDDCPPIHGMEVPVLKEDNFIQDSMYQDDFCFVNGEDPPPHAFDPSPPAEDCSICFRPWTVLHSFGCIPCGHIFGVKCIQEWLKTNSFKCPKCRVFSSLKDVRHLQATPLCIPPADKGVADQEITIRRFPFSNKGIVKFTKFEIGWRNFALKKRSDVKKRLAGVVERKNDLMKWRTDLLDRRDSVLNRAKALEQRGSSLRLRADRLRLQADAFGRWADEYLLKATACEGRAKALSQRAGAYNQRINAYTNRVVYFCRSYNMDGLRKNTPHSAL